ncbi:MAG: 50S ribosome-binding GTPase, partial [SAR324 cluster bacterium]|nr:50S ribosome-binding GTPase [SAR324 cluster bacterium]
MSSEPRSIFTPISLSLVSHTNAGKTTLARTLLRRDVGEVLDQAHVTEEAEPYTLLEPGDDGGVLLWDTPGFGDSARLRKRLEGQSNPLGWILSQTWDRFADRPLWCGQQAVKNMREQSDAILYLVNAAEDPEMAGYLEAELFVLARVEKPVVVVLNYTGAPRGAEDAELTAFFEHLRAGLPPAADAAGGSPGEIQVCLAQRAEAIHAAFGGFYRERRGELERSSLAAGHAYGILHGHTRLVDALHRFAFEFALEDLLPLLKMRCSEWATELTFTRTQLEQKVRQMAEFATQTAAADVEPGDTPSQRAYYRDIEAGLGQEHAALEARIAALEAKLSAGRTFRLDRRSVERRLAAFARGGYGRAELGFASDLDTGYCIDGRGLAPGESEPLRELILRMEALLRGAGLETVHQYFEIGEDLSRFARPEAQHTITSVLEGRVVVGSAALLRELQEQFRGLVGFERFAARKLEEFRSQHVPSLSAMDLKEDAGGLRSIQIPLWLAGLAHEAESYSMAGLLALAHREGLLTPGEAERLAQALELLHDLRNGIAVLPPAPNYAAPNVANRGGEARNSGAAHSNLLDAAAKARYVEGKRRFATVDDLERYRLRLVDDVRRLSHKLAGKVLDRTVVRRSGSLDVTVHLKSGTITALTPRGGPPSGLAELLREERCLLGLFEFVAETGYRFADEIRERLAELVPGAVPARGDGTREARAQAFWRIMNGPSAHRAMEE